MKERPIMFSAPMVKAILAGTKTQTRRVIKRQPVEREWITNGLGDSWQYAMMKDSENACLPLRCPYGSAGDRLWVRETWADMTACYQEPLEGESPLNVAFKADNSVWNVYGKAAYLEQLGQAGLYVDKWKPSIHMHRQSSRITLEITNVRVGRLNEISDADALAEGILPMEGNCGFYFEEGQAKEKDVCECCDTPILRYQELWDKINGKKYPWSTNPWVWVVEFTKI